MHSQGLRTRIVLSTFLMASLGASANAANKTFDGSVNNTWSAANNWTASGVPLPGDDVFLGNHVNVENEFITLDINDTITNLTITDGVALSTAGQWLIVSDTTTISGRNELPNNVVWPSRISLTHANGLPALDTNYLILQDRGGVDMGVPSNPTGPILEVDVLADIQDTSFIYGHGEIRLKGNNARSLVNDGSIQAGTQGLIINQLGTGLIDLDGDSGNGRLNAGTAKSDGTAFSNVTINGTALNDTFNGSITLVTGGFLAMNLTEGWSTGAGSEVRVSGSSSDPDPNVISGGNWTMEGGLFRVSGINAKSDVAAEVEIQPNAEIEVGVEDTLRFIGFATINGGTFTLEEDASLDFEGFTYLRGGSFNTLSTLPSDGTIEFSGTTYWQGDVALNGNASQSDTAIVSSASSLTGGRFNMDGGSGNTHWEINSSLTLDVISIDTGNNTFDGSIEFGGGILSKLTVNLSTPNAPWTMAGAMELNGNQLGFITRIAGTHVYLDGDVTASSNSQITADATITSMNNWNWASPSSKTRFMAETRILQGAEFNNTGTLVNGNTGLMKLYDGADLDLTFLENHGELVIGNNVNQIGNASMAGFINHGLLTIDLAGSGAGEFDHLQLSGAAELSGTLDLNLLNGFIPEPGEFMTIIDTPQVYQTFDTILGQIISPTQAMAVIYTTTQVRVAGALPGDANLDGAVDLLDLSILAQSFEGDGTWVNGDFNGDGTVDLLDLSLLASNFGSDIGSLPEPGMATLLSLGLILGSRRKTA